MPDASGVTMSFGKPMSSCWNALHGQVRARSAHAESAVDATIGRELRGQRRDPDLHPRDGIAAIQRPQIGERRPGRGGYLIRSKAHVGGWRASADARIERDDAGSQALDRPLNPAQLDILGVEGAYEQNGRATSGHRRGSSSVLYIDQIPGQAGIL